MKIPIAMSVALLAQVAAAENLWPNPGFESWSAESGLPSADARQWRVVTPFRTLEQSGAASRSGRFSLHLVDDDNGRSNSSLAYVPPYDVLKRLRGKKVTFSAWVRQERASRYDCVRVNIWSMGKAAGIVSDCFHTGTAGKTGWTRITAKAVVPEDATVVNFGLDCASGFGCTAEAYFDDVSISVGDGAESAAGRSADEIPADLIPPSAASIVERSAKETFSDDGRERPVIRNGTFYAGGRPVFFVGPWIYNHPETDWPESNPDRQGIGHRAYVNPPGKAIFESMGFNASQLSAAWSIPGQAAYGLDLPKDWRRRRDCVMSLFARMDDQPMVVDFAFGFANALKEQKPELWREIEQHNPRWHEFVPVCPECPDGDRYYREYMRTGAANALKGGANVFVWELFNESSYLCNCRWNAAGFARRAKESFGTIKRANEVWKTDFESFADVAAQTEFSKFPRLWPDYMKFMAERYAEILRRCARVVRSVDRRKNVYFTEQSSVSHIEKAFGSGVDYRLVADALDVIAHEGGLQFGSGEKRPAPANEMEDVVFGRSTEHFFDMDLYQALSRGTKPILNDELYCTRIENGLRVPSRREDIATTLWAELFHGSSGAFVYCWDKRSWEWKTLEDARKVVEKPSYKSASLLNPWNYPPAELDGFKMFRDELEPFRDRILAFPRTRPASVAVFFSYPTVRMLNYSKIDCRERLLRWYGAVLHAHYPVKIVFEEDLEKGLPGEIRALVVPSAEHATAASLAAVRGFAARGGTVVADAGAFLKDERGDALPEFAEKIVRLDADSDASVKPLRAALAASGARRDAVLTVEGTGAYPAGSDVQIIDRGDFKLLCFVAMGEFEAKTGILRWNVGREGNYRLENAVSKRLIPSGKSETWSAEALARGIRVRIPPQKRILLSLVRQDT